MIGAVGDEQGPDERRRQQESHNGDPSTPSNEAQSKMATMDGDDDATVCAMTTDGSSPQNQTARLPIVGDDSDATVPVSSTNSEPSNDDVAVACEPYGAEECAADYSGAGTPGSKGGGATDEDAGRHARERISENAMEGG